MNKFTKFSQPFFFVLFCLTLLAGGQAFGQIRKADYIYEPQYDYETPGNARLLADNDGSGGEGIIFATRNNKIWGAFDAKGVLQINPVVANNSIGTRPDSEKLYVNGGATMLGYLKIKATSFPDYVFAHNYDLMPLGELDTYIQKNKHLPKIPKAEKVIKEGINVAQMNVLLMEKVEELTLHAIAKHQQIKQLMKKVEALETSLKK